MTAKEALRIAIAFLGAVVATAILASVVQTQINLASITRLGIPVPLGPRLATTAQDLLRFGPVMAAIIGGAFLPAFAAAALAVRRRPSWRPALFALAGAAGLWAAFQIMGFFTPMPTLIAAVRGTTGLALMSATGALGGLLFAMRRREMQRAH